MDKLNAVPRSPVLENHLASLRNTGFKITGVVPNSDVLAGALMALLG
jgi:hypothetical protein